MTGRTTSKPGDIPRFRQIYGLFGATPQVLAKKFDYPHNYNQVSREFMYAWLNRHLKLGAAEPVAEKPFVADAAGGAVGL